MIIFENYLDIQLKIVVSTQQTNPGVNPKKKTNVKAKILETIKEIQNIIMVKRKYVTNVEYEENPETENESFQ